MLLTQNSTFIIGPVAKILGLIMNAIFEFLNLIKIPNIGLAIIIFTIVIYLLLLPLTIKQQKFSKLSAKMSPEIQAIQNKYKDKKNDQAAMMAMNSETQAVYAKYGVSLPHSSKAQANCGTRIDVSEVQPGDLVFYGGKNIHHVAMYIGNGQVVHAWNSRAGITTTSMYYNTPTRAVRLLDI